LACGVWRARRRRSVNPDPSNLRRLTVFASLPDEDIEQISKWFEVRSVEAGRRVISEGASGYSFFVIQEGTADVSLEGRAIRTLGPGDFFGEMALLDSGRRTADVVATSPMKLAAMFGGDFRQLQVRFPEVADRIEAVATER
jgi:CRP-like cAMP-binding protein